MRKRKSFVSLLITTLAAFVLSLCAGIFLTLDAKKVNAAYTNEGGVDHYTDMTSNGVDLEYYDTLYNEDWKRNGGAALTETWDMTDDYYITFTPSESNTTGSFVWKFTYTCTNTAAVNIYPLCGGAWPSNGNSTVFNFHDYGFETGKTYEVELGVVKVKNSTNYFVFVKADGVFKMGTYRDESLKQGNGLYFYLTGGDGVLVSEKPEVVYECEDYAVVQNDDLGLASSYTAPSGDATNGVGFTNELTTASYVYKFNYTPADSNDAIVYMRSAYWGGESKLNCYFRGTQIIYQINGVDNVVSDLFTMDETSVVELGAIDIKDSENTWIFVKVNGETVLSQVVDATVAAQTKGMSFFGTSQSVFTQYAWTVDFNGETREVVNGAAIGELPSAPESNYEFIGWADLYGNILTAETVITENFTAMPIFNEPHTVTFVVNGETLTTLENVGYQETVTPPECSVPGYDFVKWIYGDNVEFTAETQVVSNLTVMAVLAARDFTADELADYIVVTNKDIGAAASITNTNSMYGNYSYVTDNATTSVVYKFVYIRGEKPLYLAVRDVKDGWGANADKDETTVSGYQFILNGTYLESPLCDSIVAFPTENGVYLVEIGAIDVKNSSEVWVYVKVNGETVVDIRAAAPVGVGNYIGMWGDDASTSTFNEANDYHFLEGVVEKHTAVEVEALAATCTEEGHTAYSYCEDCKAVLLEKEIIDALGHEEEAVEGYSATCTETGLTDGVVCTVCEEVLTEQTEIAALGHDLQAVEAVAPDCETVGATAGEKCVREGCDMIVSGCEEIAAKGHTAVTDEAVASTCIERGKTEGSHCGDCGKILQEQESLPLAGHNYVDGVCSVCGDEDVSAVVPEDSSNDSSAEENNGSSGCSGSVGSAFGGIVMVIGATAIFLKKKKEEK